MEYGVSQQNAPDALSRTPAVTRSSFVMKVLRSKQPYFLMAPTMIWLLGFIVYPLIFSIVMALKQFKLKKGLTFWDMPWVGLLQLRQGYPRRELHQGRVDHRVRSCWSPSRSSS